VLALDYRPSKRLRAALTLAAVYAAGVTVLLLTVISSADSPRRVLQMLPLFSIPAALCFAVAFLLLAVARRAGFTALWAVVFGLWVLAASQDFNPFAANTSFVSWSFFAAPLYAMCAVGFPSSSQPPRWRQWMSVALWPAWAALVALAFAQLRLLNEYEFLRGQYIGSLGRSLQLALWVTPPAITLVGILRVHSRPPAEHAGPHGIAS